METGDEDGGRNPVLHDAAGEEGNDPVGRPQIDLALPGRQAGAGQELAAPDAVAGPELLPRIAARNEPDQGGRSGEPELGSVVGQILDVHALEVNFRLLAQDDQPVPRRGAHAFFRRHQAGNLVAGEAGVMDGKILPNPVWSALQEAFSRGGNP